MKVCNMQGCPELTRTPYCEAHTERTHGWHTSTRVTPKGWDRTRRRILRRDRNKCVMCGRPAAVVDHLLPTAWGGGEDPRNLRALCRTCDRAKVTHESALGRQLKSMSESDRHEAIDRFIEAWEA